MTFAQLLLKNVKFYWRTHLAVVLGVIAATAAIVGALIVGDSVRDSLVEMSNVRLGKIDNAVLGGRFFRESLADEFQAVIRSSTDSDAIVAPVLVMQGTVEVHKSADQVARAGQINVYGVTNSGWELLDHAQIAVPQAGEVVLNERLASQLDAGVGATVSLVVEIPSAIPRDSLLGERNETVSELQLKVTAIAPDELGLARLGMNPTQQLPANIYLSLPDLQSVIGLEARQRSRTQPVAKLARINSLFVSVPGLPVDAEAADRLNSVLHSQLALSDLNLKVVEHTDRGYIALESDQMYLDSVVTNSSLESASKLGAETSPVLVYLLNEIWNQASPEKHSMYSVIAGVDPSNSAPFGPFQFVGESHPLEGNAVYLNEWLAEDLGVTVGETIRTKYHVVGDRGELPEAEQDFVVAGIVKLEGVADDRGYTPDVPGVTDAETYADWREPFPLKRDRITDRDDEYWENYRTTPKMFVSLSMAKSLWQSRYGELTTFRVAPAKGESLDDLKSSFERELLASVSLPSTGLAVQPVRFVGLKAAQGTTDFTGLFIGFSFFLILSATMLVALLFRLGVEQRLKEIGLLNAIGLQPHWVRRMLLSEGAILVCVGGLFGLAAAIGYASIMIYGLKTWWYGAIGTKFLYLSVHPLSLLIGFLLAVVVALLAIWWAQRQATQQSSRSLLAGAMPENWKTKSPWISKLLAFGGLGGSALLLVLSLIGLVPDVEAFGGFSWRIVVFFLIGIGMLTGSLAALSLLLKLSSTLQIKGGQPIGQMRLGFKNAARNRSRSVMTASLIACATFVIVAVAAGQMNPIGDTPRKRSGNGGFTLVAQTNVPVLYDLNTPEGRGKAGLNVSDPKSQQVLNQSRIFPFRMKLGENASCLNLYQTQLPTILGVPEDVLNQLIEEDRFLFADTHAEHPWELLRETLPEQRIPVLGDMNTLMYSMHKGIGATVNVPDDDEPQHSLQIAGMFANSVFQGVLVMSEKNFLKVFPEQAGFRYFLIDVDPSAAPQVSQILESQLGDYGFDVDRVSDRLADFLSVQNTYLSTFQTLGGLGLLLGTIGLATVMLRNVLERAGEFALLRAVGFQAGQIGKVVVWENAFLLGSGLLCGAIAALISMAPHLMTTVANVPWGSLGGLLIGVFIVGMLAAIVAVRVAVRTPILSTLRGE
ncbi:FtsX-like permease family protein [Planctomicrobium sp. SH668]|uniref:ABC transporter permease n=1 Tax=Planctomicrobium sp. SH668 TaxID=3448126 RepID=UPI003F5B88D1